MVRNNELICGAITQAKIVKRANDWSTEEQVLVCSCIVMVLEVTVAKSRKSSRRVVQGKTTCLSLLLAV